MSINIDAELQGLTTAEKRRKLHNFGFDNADIENILSNFENDNNDNNNDEYDNDNNNENNNNKEPPPPPPQSKPKTPPKPATTTHNNAHKPKTPPKPATTHHANTHANAHHNTHHNTHHNNGNRRSSSSSSSSSSSRRQSSSSWLPSVSAVKINNSIAANNSVKIDPPICPPTDLGSSAFSQCLAAKLQSALPRGNGDGCDTSKGIALGAHQQVAQQVARMIAQYGPDKLNGCRGLLCWHNTGSGKTISSLAIALEFFASGRNIIVCTTADNRQDNNVDKYADNFMSVFRDKFSMYIGKRATGDYVADRETAKAKLARMIKFHTFETLARLIGVGGQQLAAGPQRAVLLGGKGSVVIMDEAHGIANPKRYKEAAEALGKFLAQESAMKKVVLFALTATPGPDGVQSFLNTINLVRRVGQPLITTPDLKAIRGLVSYADVRGDRTRWAALSQKDVRVPMHSLYYAAFLYAYATDKNGMPSEDKPDKWLDATRRASNVLNKTAWTAFVGPEDQADLQSKGLIINDKFVSAKLAQLVKNITHFPGKQYVYTVDTRNAVPMLEAMLKRMGYSPVTYADVPMQTVQGSSGTKRVSTIHSKSNAHRYILYKTTSDVPKSARGDLRAAFDDPANARGEKIKIFIATGDGYQGVDLKGLRAVHLLEPMSSQIKDIQALGRGQRLCGHKQLSQGERNVTVLRYYNEPPPNFSVDKLRGRKKGKAYETKLDAVDAAMRKLHGELKEAAAVAPKGSRLPLAANVMMYYKAKLMHADVTAFEACVKRVSVDCPLMSAFHGITCGGETCTIPKFQPQRHSAQKQSSSSSKQQPGGLTALLGLSSRRPSSTSSSSSSKKQLSAVHGGGSSKPHAQQFPSSTHGGGHGGGGHANHANPHHRTPNRIATPGKTSGTRMNTAAWISSRTQHGTHGSSSRRPGHQTAGTRSSSSSSRQHHGQQFKPGQKALYVRADGSLASARVLQHQGDKYVIEFAGGKRLVGSHRLL